jgi:predicted nucleic acid-binding protein
MRAEPKPRLILDTKVIISGVLFKGKAIRSLLLYALSEFQLVFNPKDNKFLSLALDADVMAIVTSDKELKVLHPYKGIAIPSPADFMRLQMPAPQ